MVTFFFMQIEIRMMSHSLKFNHETVTIRWQSLNILKHIRNINNKHCFKLVIHNIMKCIIKVKQYSCVIQTKILHSSNCRMDISLVLRTREISTRPSDSWNIHPPDSWNIHPPIWLVQYLSLYYTLIKFYYCIIFNTLAIEHCLEYNMYWISIQV
jgi:hypothetical protein